MLGEGLWGLSGAQGGSLLETDHAKDANIQNSLKMKYGQDETSATVPIWLWVWNLEQGFYASESSSATC